MRSLWEVEKSELASTSRLGDESLAEPLSFSGCGCGYYMGPRAWIGRIRFKCLHEDLPSWAVTALSATPLAAHFFHAGSGAPRSWRGATATPDL